MTNNENENQSFSVSGRLPDFNGIIKAAKTRFNNKGTTGYTKLAKETLCRIREAIRTKNLYPVERIFLNILWVDINKRRDPDNIASSIKFILDALQLEGIIKNDGWSQIAGWSNSFETGNEAVTIIDIINR